MAQEANLIWIFFIKLKHHLVSALCDVCMYCVMVMALFIY